jgi:purine-binding chemotaxis protein CheW
MQSTKQAIFTLGEEQFGIDIMVVNTIEKPINVEPVANFPKNLRGIIKLRGDIIPLYSLRRKFGMEDVEPSVDTRFIITTSNDIQIAYEVDKMTEIAQIEEDQWKEAPSIVKGKDTSYMKAITNLNDSLIILLDQNGILTEEEINKIKTVIKI